MEGEVVSGLGWAFGSGEGHLNCGAGLGLEVVSSSLLNAHLYRPESAFVKLVSGTS